MPFFIPVLVIAAASGLTGVGLGAKGANDIATASKRAGAAQRRLSAASDTTADAFRTARESVAAWAKVADDARTGPLADFIAFVEEEVGRTSVGDIDLDAPDIDLPRFAVSDVGLVDPIALIFGTVSAAGAAAATPPAVLALVTAFGTAGTGTAISTLSGAAATNAALASLGGGTLAAGGGGVALGSTVLTGVAAGPALLVGGLVLASQGESALTRASQLAASADAACAELAVARALAEGVVRRAREQSGVVAGLAGRLAAAVAALRARPWDSTDDVCVRQFQAAYAVATALTAVLRTPLLRDDSSLNDDPFPEA